PWAARAPRPPRARAPGARYRWGRGVVACGSSRDPRRLAFETKSFEEIVEPPQFDRIAGERTARIDDGGTRLIGLAEHHIRANEPQPSLDIGAVAMQPLGKPLDHTLNHGLALLGSQLRGRSRLFGPRPATGAPAGWSWVRLGAPPLEPPGAPARSTRASARRSKSSHGASGGAASISARQVAAACVRSPSCSAASPRK